LSERITTGYVQGEALFFEHRLRVLTGVRFERTDDEGHGPLFDPNAAFQRDASGRLLRVNGALVRKPEAGTVGSLQELALTRKERGAKSERSYDGYYPSLHLTFNATPNFIVRAAYAETFGRPDLSLILPNTTVGTENPAPAPGSPPGTITITNAGLKPYAAKNYDVSLEYYFPQGGVASVGGFKKDLENFFGTLNTIATAALLDQFGLEDTYVGWTLQSRINVGTAKISGVEINYTQPLTFLPKGGKYLSVFANYTRIKLEGPSETDFTGFIPESASLGLTYSRKPIIAVARWNYRGLERRGVSTVVPDGFDYLLPYPSVDLSIEYQLSRHVTIFANSRNALGAAREYRRYSAVTPFYASYFRSNSVGVQTAIGIKGTF
jgi:TonB-dependent receptor